MNSASNRSIGCRAAAPGKCLLAVLALLGHVFAAAQTIALNLMSQMKTQAMMTVKIIRLLRGGINLSIPTNSKMRNRVHPNRLLLQHLNQAFQNNQ